MNKIREAFTKGKAFIPFITCGDPDTETTAACVREMVKNGADLVELGIPFSDPTAEGPVIQEANLRALNGGMMTDRAFGLVRELRRDVTVPLVFMTYANVVFSYGAERFLAGCEEAGVDGIILPDLPYEEKEEFLDVCREHGIALISMIAPTSANRVAMIAREAEDHPDNPGKHGCPLRDRVRDIRPGTGTKNGRPGGRRYCRIGDRAADRAVREGFGGSRRSLCEGNESGDQTAE